MRPGGGELDLLPAHSAARAARRRGGDPGTLADHARHQGSHGQFLETAQGCQDPFRSLEIDFSIKGLLGPLMFF